jgi:cellulose synthase/poly-beta-1,6-N-acetylglucosamine synthase-like glycosyltransferase
VKIGTSVRISIVICNYNYAAYLDAAIRSAVEHDYPNKEIIIVDDGSTDGSREIVARWGDSIRAIYKPNGGQISAYNAGFAHVTGDVVIFLDSDDLLDRNACARVAEAFDADTVKVHYRLRLIDPAGAAIGPVIPFRLDEGDVGMGMRLRGQLYQSAPGSGNAYRVSALRRLMPIPEDPVERHGADFFVTYAVSLLGKVRVASRVPLGSYRVHSPPPAHQFAFGNASTTVTEPHRTSARYRRMGDWIKTRLGESYALAPVAPDLSLVKASYARTIFSAPSYAHGVACGWPVLRDHVLPAVASRRDPLGVRAALALWAVGVLVLPRRLGFPIARYVCNPATRSFPVEGVAAVWGGR